MTDDILNEMQDINPEHLRDVRSLENDVLRHKAELRTEKAKLAQAEAELAIALEREQLFAKIKDDAGMVVLPKREQVGEKSPATAIVCFTDWHAEQRFSAASVNRLNEYNLQVFENRHMRALERSAFLIDLWRGAATIDEVVLWLGGDMMSGTIHPELEESNELGPAEVLSLLSKKIRTSIEFLLEELDLEKVYVVCNYGNHARTTQKLRVSTGHLHSWEYVLYGSLASWYEDNPRVCFHVEQGAHAYVDVQGWIFRFQHGNFIKYNGGIGGITIPANKAISQWNKARPAHYDVFGHWHQYLDTWSFTSVGSLAGYDPFALSIKADYQPPTQAVLLVDRRLGKVASLPVFVDRRTDQ